MKENIRKLAVFVIIAAIAMFSTVALAGHGIQGDYAVTGLNQCVVGFFNSSGLATTVLETVTGFNEAIFTFNSDGSGHYVALNHVLLNSTTYAPSYEAAEFTYTIDGGGPITFKPVTCTHCAGCASLLTPGDDSTCIATNGCAFILDTVPLTGVISPDGMSLNITCGAPVFLHPCTGYAGTPVSPPTAPEVACNINYTGFKVPRSYALSTIY